MHFQTNMDSIPNEVKEEIKEETEEEKIDIVPRRLFIPALQ